MDRLFKVDQIVGDPKDEEIERQRYCPNCYDGNGSLCIQCEMDGLFRVSFVLIFLLSFFLVTGLIFLNLFFFDITFRSMRQGYFW